MVQHVSKVLPNAPNNPKYGPKLSKRFPNNPKTENIEFKEVKIAPLLLSNEAVSIHIAKFIAQIQCQIIREVKFN